MEERAAAISRLNICRDGAGAQLAHPQAIYIIGLCINGKRITRVIKIGVIECLRIAQLIRILILRLKHPVIRIICIGSTSFPVFLVTF